MEISRQEKDVEMIKEAVRAIRRRPSMNVPPSKKANVYVVSEDPQVLDIFDKGRIFFATLAMQARFWFSRIRAVSQTMPYRRDSAGSRIYMPFAELVDLEKEIERLKKRRTSEKELARVNGMLSNESSSARPPGQD